VLTKLVDMAVNGTNEASKVKATELIGKTEGMFREVTESREAALSDEQIIADLSEGDPALAEMLRKRLGI
jgi:hypothetical protein